VALVAGATALALPMQGQEQVKTRVPVVLWHGAAPPQNPRAKHMFSIERVTALLRGTVLSNRGKPTALR
jgi:hypothetical protein